MWTWKEASAIKDSLTEYTQLDNYIPLLKKLSIDQMIPKYATHLVYMTKSEDIKKIENKVIYSILQQRPKRADIYWFVHVETTDDPSTREYKVDIIVPQDIVRITFKLGRFGNYVLKPRATDTIVYIKISQYSNNFKWLLSINL